MYRMNKQYDVLLVDPPWQAGFKGLRKWKSEITDKYQTLSLSEIRDMDVSSLAKKDSSLFLWCTHTTLPDALSIMSKWGFKYHCTLTWDKGSGFSVAGFHRRTEFCIYGYRGKMNINKRGKFIPTLMVEKRTVHSRKPTILYSFIEQSFPSDRLELFARRKRPGWDVWGNEVDSDIKL